MFNLFASTPAPTRRWVAAVFAWLGVWMIVELVVPESMIVDIAVILGLPAAYGTAGWLILSKRSRLPVEERTPWSLLAIGTLTVAVGMLTQLVASLISPQLSAFGPIDLVFMAAYALVLTGFGLLPQLKTELVSRQRLVLDGLVGAVSIAALMWIFIGRDLYAELATSPRWDLVLGSTYPVLDFVGFVVVMLVVLRRSNYRFDPRLMAVGFTFLAQGFGDILYFRAGIGSSFLEANPILSLHIVAAASILVCALVVERRPEPREFPDRYTSWPALLAPYGTALLLGAVTVVEIMSSETLDTSLRFLLIATSVVTLLVIVRQFLAIRDNRALVEKERDALVSSISHELRTPLTAVVGYLDLLTPPSQMSDHEREELLLVAKDQANQLSGLVSDLVLAARDNPRSLELKRKPTNLRPLIDDALRHVDGSLEVVIDCPDSLSAEIDAERAHQALVNLVVNAHRYGGSRCHVVARKRGRLLVLEVHDDGPGVPERHQHTIWKRFERGAHRLDASSPGSGIGLALVETISRAHGGFASYRTSERLGGACFQMILPEPAESELRPSYTVAARA
ncbi:MAG: sensor histidine kinase [Actinomycetota bacterium]